MGCSKELRKNPWNLIQFVLAEGRELWGPSALGAEILKKIFLPSAVPEREGTRMPKSFLHAGLLGASLSIAVLPAHGNDDKLTIYTYDSFASEWGPGPVVERAFEATCFVCA